MYLCTIYKLAAKLTLVRNTIDRINLTSEIKYTVGVKRPMLHILGEMILRRGLGKNCYNIA